MTLPFTVFVILIFFASLLICLCMCNCTYRKYSRIKTTTTEPDHSFSSFASGTLFLVGQSQNECTGTKMAKLLYFFSSKLSKLKKNITEQSRRLVRRLQDRAAVLKNFFGHRYSTVSSQESDKNELVRSSELLNTSPKETCIDIKPEETCFNLPPPENHCENSNCVINIAQEESECGSCSKEKVHSMEPVSTHAYSAQEEKIYQDSPKYVRNSKEETQKHRPYSDSETSPLLGQNQTVTQEANSGCTGISQILRMAKMPDFFSSIKSEFDKEIAKTIPEQSRHIRRLVHQLEDGAVVHEKFFGHRYSMVSPQGSDMKDVVRSPDIPNTSPKETCIDIKPEGNYINLPSAEDHCVDSNCAINIAQEESECGSCSKENVHSMEPASTHAYSAQEDKIYQDSPKYVRNSKEETRVLIPEETYLNLQSSEKKLENESAQSKPRIYPQICSLGRKGLQ